MRLLNHNQINDVWDSFGFAGANGNIQYIKILQNHFGHLTSDIILGCTQFHKNGILSQILKENPSFAKFGLINSIKYENIEAISQFIPFTLENELTIDVNITDYYKKTPLHYASRAKLLPIVLIHKGADINAEDELKNTPLHEAAKSDSLEIAQLFLDNKVNIEHENKSRKTPLLQTAQFNSKKVCQLLL